MRDPLSPKSARAEWTVTVLQAIEHLLYKHENTCPTKKKKKKKLMPQTCNPSYSGGQKQEDSSLKPALSK
jgi:hypothetical protein